MNQTATRRVRQSASIAATALRDPSTAAILRETGFDAVHDLPDRPSRQATRENPEVSLDFSDDSPQPFFDGSPVDAPGTLAGMVPRFVTIFRATDRGS